MLGLTEEQEDLMSVQSAQNDQDVPDVVSRCLSFFFSHEGKGLPVHMIPNQPHIWIVIIIDPSLLGVALTRSKAII